MSIETTTMDRLERLRTKYDLDLRAVADGLEIADTHEKRLLVQFPDGLKQYAVPVARWLEERLGVTAGIVADPCYGACDRAAGHVSAFSPALLLQFGHAPMPSISEASTSAGSVPVKHIPLHMTTELQPARVVDELATRLSPACLIGLVTTIQYILSMLPLRTALAAAGYTVLVGDGDSRVTDPGQVLGCNFSAARMVADEVDTFLYIGTGMFHPLGVALATGKRTLVFDPLAGTVRDISDTVERVLRQRHGAIVRAGDARNFGILVGTKIGQCRTSLALAQKQLLETHDRSGIIFTLDHFSPAHLLGFGMDAYVSTACPRIAIDDYLRYDEPILTPTELEIVLGTRDWADYRLDEFEETR